MHEEELEQGWKTLPKQGRQFAKNASFQIEHPVRMLNTAIRFGRAWFEQEGLADKKFATFLYNGEKKLVAVRFTDGMDSDQTYILNGMDTGRKERSPYVSSTVVISAMKQYDYPLGRSLKVLKLRDGETYVILKPEVQDGI